ncbi:MAG: cysteine hydrolase family protein [Nanoarchaeota archaeon]|nr:cysteine hydrolase family protein [Nanoarchaeota archaeon]
MRTIFWNVDTQYDFMRPDGKLYVQGAERIEGNLAKLTELAATKGIKVVNTADWHNKDSKELSENPDFIQTFPEHCMENTLGAKFVPATSPQNAYWIDWREYYLNSKEIEERRNIVLFKDKFDVFAGTPHADSVLEILAPERVVVYGVATNVCVNDAVLGLLERRVEVYVPIDSIKELPNLPLPYETWKARGAVLTTTERVYRMLQGERA